MKLFLKKLLYLPFAYATCFLGAMCVTMLLMFTVLVCVPVAIFRSNGDDLTIEGFREAFTHIISIGRL